MRAEEDGHQTLGLHEPHVGQPVMEGQFQALLESTPDSIVIVDRDGQIVLINSETERLFGYQRPELLGQPIELLLPERFREEHRDHRARYLVSPRSRPMGSVLELMATAKTGVSSPPRSASVPWRPRTAFW